MDIMLLFAKNNLKLANIPIVMTSQNYFKSLISFYSMKILA